MKSTAILFAAILVTVLGTVHAEDTGLHAVFDQILTADVKDGQVDYPSIQRRPAFQHYLSSLAKPFVSSNKEEQLAFWINAYNASVISGILNGKSPSTFFGRITFFKTTKYRLNDQSLDLYHLEHKIIRPFGEPRIHFAINCASASCPKLASHAYTAEQLDQQLENSARSFINDPSRNRFDPETRTAFLSEIFDWFAKDFEQHSGSVQKYLAQYVEDPRITDDLAHERYNIKYLPYDWSLNGTPVK